MLPVSISKRSRKFIFFGTLQINCLLMTIPSLLQADCVRLAESKPIESKSYWAQTHIQVEAGRTYQMEVLYQDVADGDGWMRIPVKDLCGWPNDWHRIAAAPLFWFRRRPFSPWFALIATVDQRKPFRLEPGQSPLGVAHDEKVSWSRPFVAPATGELICYFNDVPWAYGNNHGSIVLRLHGDKRHHASVPH